VVSWKPATGGGREPRNVQSPIPGWVGISFWVGENIEGGGITDPAQMTGPPLARVSVTRSFTSLHKQGKLHFHPSAQLQLSLDQGRAAIAQDAIPPARPPTPALQLLLIRAHA
jgi:hypothetical protein